MSAGELELSIEVTPEEARVFKFFPPGWSCIRAMPRSRAVVKASID